jgi:predicted phosphoribosyltransferase
VSTFRDRADAGARLAAQLAYLRAAAPVVLGLPRGGVPVAAAVARSLDAPLDVLVARKLALAADPEYALGAIAEGGVRVVAADADTPALRDAERREEGELRRRADLYRGGRPPIAIAGRVVVIVDDGLATGFTAAAACASARAQGAASVVLAVPVAPLHWPDVVTGAADELVAVSRPDAFFAVGQAYDRFDQTSDAEVISALGRA